MKNTKIHKIQTTHLVILGPTTSHICFMNIPIPNRDQIEEKARAKKGAVEEARERWSKNSTHLKLYLLSDEVT